MAATEQMVPIALVLEPLVDSVNPQVPSPQLLFFSLDSQNQFLLLATNIRDLIQELSRLLLAEKSHHELQPLQSLGKESCNATGRVAEALWYPHPQPS